MQVVDRGEAKSTNPAAHGGHLAGVSRSRRVRFHQPADAGPFAWLSWWPAAMRPCRRGNNKLPSGRWHVTAINHPPPNPGGRPQLGVRRVRRLPMRSEPALNPNGHGPAL